MKEDRFKKKKKKIQIKTKWIKLLQKFVPFRIKVECREKSRFYTNCTVFKMARPPCKITLNDPLVPCNFTDLTRTPHSAAIFISTIHSAANWNKKMALTIWSNLAERQRAMAIPFPTRIRNFHGISQCTSNLRYN